MSRFTILKTRLLAIGVCLLLIFDLLVNLLLSLVLLVWAVATGQEGAPPSAYETMSARAGRGMLNHKLAAIACAWCIDWLFDLCRQPHTADLPGDRRFTHPSHCVRTFVKTKHLAYLPTEYSGPLPPSLEACYGRR